MNINQAAAIYLRGVLEQSRDEVIQYIHRDFTKMHGHDIAVANNDAIYQAVVTLLTDIGATVNNGDMRQAVETLTADAWAAIEQPEIDG